MRGEGGNVKIKRVTLAVEVQWAGACSEAAWISHLCELIEQDKGHDTNCRVVEAVALTEVGTSDVLTPDEAREGLLRIEAERERRATP